MFGLFYYWSWCLDMHGAYDHLFWQIAQAPANTNTWTCLGKNYTSGECIVVIKYKFIPHNPFKYKSEFLAGWLQNERRLVSVLRKGLSNASTPFLLYYKYYVYFIIKICGHILYSQTLLTETRRGEMNQSNRIFHVN